MEFFFVCLFVFVIITMIFYFGDIEYEYVHILHVCTGDRTLSLALTHTLISLLKENL